MGLSGEPVVQAKLFILSIRQGGIQQLSLSTYLWIHLHGLNTPVRLSLSILSTFTSIQTQGSLPFSLHLFVPVFSSLPSQCVVLCLAPFLCWGWRGEILEQQGSSLVTHQFWNHSMSRRQRDGEGGGHREEESNKKEGNKGRQQKKMSNRGKR